MEFRLLGPLGMVQDGLETPVGAGKLRALLAALLLDEGHAVSTDQLIEALWSGRPPASATSSLHNHVLRLRRLMGSAGDTRIRAVPAGYLIVVEPGELDVAVFDDLCAEGREALRTGAPARARELFSAALELWRGEPLADVPGADVHGARIQHLVEARSQALEARIETDLQLARHHEVIGELRAMATEQPLRESVHGQLMLALYRADRQVEALEVYQQLRRALIEELGVEPCASVQTLHGRILSADRALAVPDPASGQGPRTAAAAGGGADAPSAVAAADGIVRCNLPDDTRSFTGRLDEVDRVLAAAASAADGTDAGMVVISAIDGMGGVGKSALAIHTGHRLRRRFPDGQLFIDLQGHTSGLDPLTVDEAQEALLRQLGVAPGMVPRDPAARQAFYRMCLSDTRTLIVLDNADSAARVRPLLPGGAGCLVLVTSRRRLTGLEDAVRITLGTLPPAQAEALLRKTAGPGRIPPAGPEVDELLAACGHLPLAIRIVGSRLRLQRSLRIEHLLAALRDENARLSRLRGEDHDLTALFDHSYRHLPEAEQRLFRLLALNPGPDIDVCAAANLMATDRATAERLLESLLDHSLLVNRTTGRYRFHDLVRLFAQQVTAEEPPTERQDAFGRLVDYYVHTCRSAEAYIGRVLRAGTGKAVPVPSVVPVLTDRATSLAWMRTERDNLVALAEHPHLAAALPDRLVVLVSELAVFLLQEGPWPKAVQLHETAIDVAVRTGDRVGEANARCAQGRFFTTLGRAAEAVVEHEKAMALFLEMGNRLGEAVVACDLGRDRLASGDFRLSAEYQRRSLALCEELGNRTGQANALHGLGRVLFLTGDYQEAGDRQLQALEIFRETGHVHGEANALYDLGRLYALRGDYTAAEQAHVQAQATYLKLGHRQGLGQTCWELGRIRFTAGDFTAAADLQRKAIAAWGDVHYRTGVAYARFDLGRALHAMGEHPAAAALHEQALAAFLAEGDRLGEANARLGLGQSRQATGAYGDAQELIRTALSLFHDLGDRQGEAEVLCGLGALLAETVGLREARAAYQEALDIAQEIGSPLDEAHALDGIACCSHGTGDVEAAARELGEAVAIYRRLGAGEEKAAAARLGVLEELVRKREAMTTDVR